MIIIFKGLTLPIEMDEAGIRHERTGAMLKIKAATSIVEYTYLSGIDYQLNKKKFDLHIS